MFLFSPHFLKAEGVLEQLKGKEGAWRVVEVADFPLTQPQTLGMKIVLNFWITASLYLQTNRWKKSQL